MVPLIGITPTPNLDTLAHGIFLRYTLSSRYVAAVEAAGGVPLVLPVALDQVDPFLDIVDGLLLSGGGDLEPWRFGETVIHPATYGLAPDRDAFELGLVDSTLAAGLPILGICRGIQVLNVALGGTLHQHLDGANGNGSSINHRQHELGRAAHEVGHQVMVTEDWPLRDPLAPPTSTLGVNSFHHQAIARLGSNLTAVAHAPDGTIEGVVGTGQSFVLGVQWHPELMFDHDPAHLAPFQALVAAASVKRLGPVPR
jgi:putative glutamine amidotransferase